MTSRRFHTFDSPPSLEVSLGGQPLVDVLRAAAGDDMPARTRAMVKLLAVQDRTIVHTILQVLPSSGHTINPGPEDDPLTFEASPLVDVLAHYACADIFAGSDICDAYVNQPWLELHPRIYCGLDWNKVSSMAYRLFEEAYGPTYVALRHRDRAERTQRALDLLETYGPHSGFVRNLTTALKAERDDELRKRIAAFLARCEVLERQADLEGDAAPKAKSKPKAVKGRKAGSRKAARRS